MLLATTSMNGLLLSIDQILFNNLIPDSLPKIRWEDPQGAAIDRIKCHEYDPIPKEKLIGMLQSIQYNPYATGISHLSLEANRIYLFKGWLGPLLCTYYPNGRVSLEGNLSQIWYGGRTSHLTGPPQMETVLAVLSNDFDMDIAGWRVVECEVAYQWWSALLVPEIAQFMGRHRARVLVRYGSQIDTTPTFYYKNSDGTWPSKHTDVLKLYERGARERAQKRYHLELQGHRLVRIERTLKTDLVIPKSLDDQSLPLWRGKRRLSVRDFAEPKIFSWLVARLVKSCLEIDKNRIASIHLDEVIGRKDVIQRERPLAIEALEGLDAAQLRNEPRAQDRAYLKTLQRKHGNIFDPHSYWGKWLRNFETVTGQHAPKEWERFHRQWDKSRSLRHR